MNLVTDGDEFLRFSFDRKERVEPLAVFAFRSSFRWGSGFPKRTASFSGASSCL